MVADKTTCAGNMKSLDQLIGAILMAIRNVSIRRTAKIIRIHIARKIQAKLNGEITDYLLRDMILCSNKSY